MNRLRPRTWVVASTAFLVYSVCVSLFAENVTQSRQISDASLAASFYSDASCLLSIGEIVQSGKTIINADVDSDGSRMHIHCDTEDGRRLTLLARGDSLNVAQRAPLLDREQISNGEFGMIAWLSRSGIHYSDDSAPRRYVVGGSVKMRQSPTANTPGSAPNSDKQSFASINGVIEELVRTDEQSIEQLPETQEEQTQPESSISADSADSDSASQPRVQDAPETTE